LKSSQHPISTEKKLSMVACTYCPSYAGSTIGGPQSPISKITKAKSVGGVVSVVALLPSKNKALSSTPQKLPLKKEFQV
jgi:hypothetical protein